MKIKYDSKTDALYIDLSSGKYEKTKKITDAILVDISRDGKILGIEILDASENIRHFDPHGINISSELKSLSSRQI